MRVLYKPTQTAYILVDPNRDFCTGGSLAVKGADEALAGVPAFLERYGKFYDLVLATSDFHIEPGDHFSDEPDYVGSWPVHCVAGTDGALFHGCLDGVVFDEIVYKGAYGASYTGFDGVTRAGRSLDDVLRTSRIRWVVLAGLATDYCVRATALSALEHGYGVTMLAFQCAGVDDQSTQAALAELRSRGVFISERPHVYS